MVAIGLFDVQVESDATLLDWPVKVFDPVSLIFNVVLFGTMIAAGEIVNSLYSPSGAIPPSCFEQAIKKENAIRFKICSVFTDNVSVKNA